MFKWVMIINDDDDDDRSYYIYKKPLTPVPHMIYLVRDLASSSIYITRHLNDLKRTLWPHLEASSKYCM